MFTLEAKGNMNKKTVGAHLKLLMQGATAFRGAPNERKSAFPTPGTVGFLKKNSFGTRRTTKNKKNARSAGAERVKTKKIAVRQVPNA